MRCRRGPMLKGGRTEDWKCWKRGDCGSSKRDASHGGWLHPAWKDGLSLRQRSPDSLFCNSKRHIGAEARGMIWTVERKVPYLTCSLPKRKVCSSFSCPPAACRPLTGVHLCDAAAHQLGRRSLFRKIRVLITWLACLSRYSSNFAELADLTIPGEGGRTLGSRISWCCWRFQLLVSSTKSYLSTS